MADMNTADVRPKYDIRFPSEGRGVDQDQEWAEIGLNGSGKLTRFRFHDYDKLYEIPGLYEQIFYEELECQSPQVVTGLLGEVLASENLESEDLRVFDVGAGNGMVGEELAKLGADTIVGVDIIEEAAQAAERDRPHVYDKYHVLDLTDIPPAARSELEGRQFNTLVCVAALGFGDIPTARVRRGLQPGPRRRLDRLQHQGGVPPGGREQRLLAADRPHDQRGRDRDEGGHDLPAPPVDRRRAAGLPDLHRPQAGRRARSLDGTE